MCKKLLVKLFIIFSVFVPTTLLATTVRSFTENLLAPTAIVTQMLVYACYIVGVIFCFMAIAQYKVHRESPKLVPLSTPVMLLLFGIVLALLPYLSTLFNTGSALEYSKKAGIFKDDHRGLALPPLEHSRRAGPGDFSGTSQKESSSSADQRASSKRKPVKPAPTPDGEPQHWSDEPQYR